MRRSRLPLVISAAALALGGIASAAGCGSADGGREPGRPQSGDAGPSRSPEALGAQAGRLLVGGPVAFRAQLEALEGTPVVVNQWASWCGPCKFEFPFFIRLARRYSGRVAFVGVNSQDGQRAARRFLRTFNPPFPSFFDPTTSVARVFKGAFAWPTTAFYDADGKLAFTHAGAYASQAALERDIRRYALRGG